MIADELRDLAITYGILYFIFGVLYGSMVFIIVIIFLQIGYYKMLKQKQKTTDYNIKKTIELMDKLFPKEQKGKVKK